MDKKSDRLLDFAADIIARLIVTAVVVLVFLRFLWRDIFIGDRFSWQAGLAGAIANGLLISVRVIRKQPEDP